MRPNADCLGPGLDRMSKLTATITDVSTVSSHGRCDEKLLIVLDSIIMNVLSYRHQREHGCFKRSASPLASGSLPSLPRQRSCRAHYLIDAKPCLTACSISQAAFPHIRFPFHSFKRSRPLGITYEEGIQMHACHLSSHSTSPVR